MKGPMLYQVSLLQALSLGRYDGSVTVGSMVNNAPGLIPLSENSSAFRSSFSWL